MTAHISPARQRTERPPLRSFTTPLLVTVLLAGVGVAVTVYGAPADYRAQVAVATGLAAVLLCAAVVVVAFQRERQQALRDELDKNEAESKRLAQQTLPALVEKLKAGAAADSALAAIEQPPAPTHQQVLRAVAEELGRSERAKAAALSACADAAGRMQALSTSMLADLRDMEHRHNDEDVLTDLLYLDHRTAQAGRLADSIAVLTGARSGRRWAKPIVMESILRGAMGRIAGYQRVRLHTTVDVAIAGHAAEGVMHALAELLDNAANFSPPTAEVHVYVEEVPAGLVVTIEDSGLVMGDFALRRAERAVSGESLDLTTLSGTRLGLAVVGCLARKHGLAVSFRPSARGGTGVIMRIPQELISRPQEQGGQPNAAGTQRYVPLGQQADAQPAQRQESLRAVPRQQESSYGSEPLAQSSTEAPGGQAGERAPGFPSELPKRVSSLRPGDRAAGQADRPMSERTDQEVPGREPLDEHSRASSAGVDQAYHGRPEQPADLSDQNGTSGVSAPAAGESRNERYSPDWFREEAQRIREETLGLAGRRPQEGDVWAAGASSDQSNSGHSASNGPQPDGTQPPAQVEQNDQPPQSAVPYGGYAPGTAPTGEPEYGPTGLPKRRRGQALAAARPTATSSQPVAPRRSAAESAARFGTFRKAVRGTPADPEPTGNTGGADDSLTPPASPTSYPHSKDDVR